jgi:hemin uptake protein HemP
MPSRLSKRSAPMPSDRTHMSACPPAPQSTGKPEPTGSSGSACLRHAQGGSAADAKPLRWTSQQLLGSQPEAQIAHAGTLYRLRLTTLGKLILTK